MTQLHHATAASPMPYAVSRLADLLQRVRHAVRRFQARQQLQRLDDRLLRDIGISRGDVAAGRF